MNSEAERPEPKKREFFGSLESLRGVAALIVVLYHLPNWYSPFHEIGIVRHGYLMVDFFFVLSGFVLQHSYVNRIRNTRELSDFIILRLGRLYPVHFVFLVIFFAIELAKYFAGGAAGGDELGDNPTLVAIMHAFGENLILTHGLGLTDLTVYLNFPSWSIATEFYTYLIFATGVVLFAPRRFLAYAGVMLAIGGSVLAFRGGDQTHHTQFPRCVTGFFLGCITNSVYLKLKDRRLKFDYASVLLIGVLIALSFAGPEWDQAHVNHTGAGAVLPISALLVLTMTLAPNWGAHTLLESRPLRWLGEVSYSLYMSHALVFWVARHAWPRIPGFSAQLNLASASLVYLLTLAAVFAVAWLTNATVENPGRRLARALVTKRQ